MTCVYPYDIAAHAPNYGGRVPVDTTPTTAPGIQLDLHNRDMSHRVQQLVCLRSDEPSGP